ncbi:MAG: RNA polymerase factor sigma-54 [Lachnospiraceae bacterium]|nr:RNA polymerase factor sigma-54 [Lachnospiraceae bacterium]
MDLVLNTSQKLLMSQKMLQSTEILQMSSTELLDYIKEMSVENPVVDYDEKNDESEKFDSIREKLDYLDASDEQNRTYYTEQKSDESENDDWKFKENSHESLEEYLMEQVNVMHCNKDIRCMASYIVGCTDENGYLKDDVLEIARILHISEEKTMQALALVQEFEPAGVCARNIQECLVIQLKRKGIKNRIAERIIEDCLETLGKNQLHIIAKKLKVSLAEVSEAVSLIKTLNPKPGNSFDSGKNFEYIVPDAIVVNGENGYEIVLNDKFFPNIGINGYYKSMMSSNDDKTKEYIQNKIKQAEWVMTCIAKRNATLMKTLESIVEIQKDFFDNGSGHVKPMCLNDVAQVIGMHESTVSRSIKQKYLQCRYGVYPLSYFFQACVTVGDEESLTPERIKIMIKDIVDDEDKKSPLSDREITEKLNGAGVEISRRTVAKYREAIGILGTSGRKA